MQIFRWHQRAWHKSILNIFWIFINVLMVWSHPWIFKKINKSFYTICKSFQIKLLLSSKTVIYLHSATFICLIFYRYIGYFYFAVLAIFILEMPFCFLFITSYNSVDLFISCKSLQQNAWFTRNCLGIIGKI